MKLANRYGHRYQHSNNSSNELERKEIEKDKMIERIKVLFDFILSLFNIS